MAQLISSLYGTGEWPKDFIEVKMIALKKKPKSTNFSDHRTISLIAHVAKIVARIHTRGIEKKTEQYLGNISLDLEEEKEQRDTMEY
jgi:hypothetical protein